MPLIAYLPFKEGTNKYIGRMRDNLAAFGEVQAFPGFKPLLRRMGLRSFKHYDAVVLNWSEGEILHPTTKRVSAKATIKVFAQALAFRAVSRRLIFVRHNVYAHSTAPQSRTSARRLMDLYERLFHQVLTHSGAEAGGPRQYCPHPLYKPAAHATADITALGLPPDYFVIFGQIAPYKKIRELMLAIPPAINLVIIGSVLDESYGAELAGIQRTNVFYRPGFISESVAQAVMTGARAAVVAHADADMVVSGSFFYAISFRTPVIAVETPFLRWVAAKLGGHIVCTAPSLSGLPAKMEAFTRRDVPGAAWQSIQAEFGDAEIRECLRSVLRLEHVTTSLTALPTTAASDRTASNDRTPP